MKNTIYNLLIGRPLPMSDILKFVKLMRTLQFPDLPYKEDITIKAFNIGFGEQILKSLIIDFRSDPNKYGYDLTMLTKDNTIIKYYLTEIK